MTLNLSSTLFLTSAAELHQAPPDEGREVAFCGRSNAGKSSAINFLTDNPKLAKTSKTPGRTQLINFFTIEDQLRLVDLPGYGYAKVPEKVRKHWHRHIDDYLRHRQSLCGIILVMDIRHPLKPFDDMMIDWAANTSLPVHILLTKSDKLKKGPATACLQKVRRNVADRGLVTVQLYSASKKIGKKELLQQLESWFGLQ
ncbi:MAG: ribosome biogenesis GTP-binding protein YihA/YsxC [Gammaproteobacteria bacterium]|nr:ribosome biogenesis GTP-binding protein YihA/YsxC [Gammaproteobacteria bacterium]